MSPLVAMPGTSVQLVQYPQHHPTLNKVVSVHLVVTVQLDHPVQSNAILENIALTRDYMFRMLTVPLVSTVGWARNPHDRMIILPEMLVQREPTAWKGVTTSHSVHPERSQTQQTTLELKIVYSVQWEVIVLDGVTRTLLGYVIRVSTVPKVSSGKIRLLTGV